MSKVSAVVFSSRHRKVVYGYNVTERMENCIVLYYLIPPW